MLTIHTNHTHKAKTTNPKTKTAEATTSEHPPAEIDQYKVRLVDGYAPVSDLNKEEAAGLDKNGNGIVSATEIFPRKSRVGHMKIDQPDYTFMAKHRLAGRTNPWSKHYPTNAQVEAKVDGLAQEYPELVHKLQIGETAEGRALHAYRIGTGEEGEKPGVLVVGNHHAREWATNLSVTETMERLLEGYGNDSEMTEKVDGLEMWFVPMANPDGYEYSLNADPEWRENRSTHSGVEGFGTDLNRNYRTNYRFLKDSPTRTDDDMGGSDEPNKRTYRGPHAVSEKESMALTNFVDTRPNLKGLVDVHSFGQMILYPTADPARTEQYEELTARVHEEIEGADYTVMPSEELYPTSGDFTAFGEASGLLSLTLEIGTSFQPGPDKLDQTVDQGASAVLGFLDYMADEHAGSAQEAFLVA